jgi:hypothetical protein
MTKGPGLALAYFLILYVPPLAGQDPGPGARPATDRYGDLH